MIVVQCMNVLIKILSLSKDLMLSVIEEVSSFSWSHSATVCLALHMMLRKN